jgi:regulatory protein
MSGHLTTGHQNGSREAGGATPDVHDPMVEARNWLAGQVGPTAAAVLGADRSSADLGARPGSSSADGSEDPDADPHAVGRAILLRKLAAQDRTRQELATALAAKNVPDEVAEELLDRFEEIGLVDDNAFARRWVESRQSRRHRSRRALRRELSGKGIERSTVDEALSEVSSDDEYEAARAYVEKVSPGMSGLQPAVRRRRLADRLARRGFGSAIIGRIVKNCGDDGAAALDPTLSDT